MQKRRLRTIPRSLRWRVPPLKQRWTHWYVVRARGSETGDAKGAIADYVTLTEMPQVPDTIKAWAILNRRSEIGDKDGIEKDIADFSAVTELPGATAEQKALGFCCRADVKSLKGDIQGAIVDYTSALEIAELPVEARVHALLVRASSRAEQGDPDGAIDDDTAVRSCQESQSRIRRLLC